MGVVSRCSVENFLSHSAENFPRGELSSVSLFSGIEKNSIGGREYQIFRGKIFVSQCQTFPYGGIL